MVDLLLRDLERSGPPVDRSIDDEDEMLHFARELHDFDEDAALAAYFRDGLSVLSAVRQLAAWRRGGLAGLESMLDFASGYGRVTRFLVREMEPDRLWVSDIYRGAVEFQQASFGVHGFMSADRPENFTAPRRFDFIFVTSLFTHLPERTFSGWLERLLGSLSPGGLLAFSVHDAALAPPGRAMPESGILFDPSSESRSLDPEAYGSTWVTESFVRAAAARLAPGAALIRLPRALGRFQDLYALDLSAEGGPRAFDPGPFGSFDLCTWRPAEDGGGRLIIRGWAAQQASGAIRSVRVWISGGHAAETRDLGDRPDVRAVVPEASPRVGFEIEVPLPARTAFGSLPMLVEAESSTGVRAPLYAGTLANALLLSTRTELALSEKARQLEIDLRRQDAEIAAMKAAELRARIAAMEASRFWKLRNAWFRVKRGLGLTDET